MENILFRQRRAMRLTDYDYALAGAYFVTICAWERHDLFGGIVDGEMHLNEYGKIAQEEWERIGERWANVELDACVIMPDHFHGVLVLKEGDGDSGEGVSRGAGRPASLASAKSSGISEFGALWATPTPKPTASPKKIALPVIINPYKSRVTKRIGKYSASPPTKVWQRDYYDHIVRDELDLTRIREYIVNNPAKWSEDQYYSVARK